MNSPSAPSTQPFKKTPCARQVALILAMATTLLPLALIPIHRAYATDFTKGGGDGGGSAGGAGGLASGGGGDSGGDSGQAGGITTPYGGGGGGGGVGGDGGAVNSNNSSTPITQSTNIQGEDGGGVSYGGGGGGGGLVATAASVTVTVSANVSGGAGAGAGAGVGDSGGGGGAGVVLTQSGGTLTNSATIAGGAGGGGGAGGAGAGGGVGVFLVDGSSSSLINNSGTINGGSGSGGGYSDIGGNGAAGVLANRGTIDNTGTILGGKAGQGDITNGLAGAGVQVNGTDVMNESGASIKGGAGANSPATATNGGFGVDFELSSGGSLTNAGTIAGGAASNSNPTVTGTGVYVKSDASGVTIINSGTIKGGVNAIDFRSGGNTLTLKDGSIIKGNINVAVSDNTLALEGTNSGNSNSLGTVTGAAGFTTVTKSDTGEWTLTGALTTPTIALQGGILTLDGASADITGTLYGASGTHFNINNGATFHGAIDPTDVALNNGGIWDMAPPSEVNQLTNGGTIRFALTPLVNNVLRVDGNYIGNGGTLVMNAVLADDNAPHDQLQVTGSTSGTTHVQVNNIGGTGATTVNGIQLIKVTGASNGVFGLVSPTGAPTPYVSGGLYDYQLIKNSAGWALSSNSVTMLRPESAGYLSNQYSANTLFQHTLDDRFTSHVATAHGYNSWGRVVGAHSSNTLGNGHLSQDSHSYLMQVGGDVMVQALSNSTVHLGLMVGAGQSQGDNRATGRDVSATSHITGYSTGLYGTWRHNSGVYLDSWLQYGWYKNSVSRATQRDSDYNSHTLMASLETGYAIAVYHTAASHWFITPQAQLIYGHYQQQTLVDDYQTTIRAMDPNTITTRLGFHLYGQLLTSTQMQITPTLSLNWWHGRQSGLQMNNNAIDQGVPTNRFESKVGVDVQLSGALHLGVNLMAQIGQNSYRSYSGQLSARYLF